MVYVQLGVTWDRVIDCDSALSLLPDDVHPELMMLVMLTQLLGLPEMDAAFAQFAADNPEHLDFDLAPRDAKEMLALALVTRPGSGYTRDCAARANELCAPNIAHFSGGWGHRVAGGLARLSAGRWAAERPAGRGQRSHLPCPPPSCPAGLSQSRVAQLASAIREQCGASSFTAAIIPLVLKAQAQRCKPLELLHLLPLQRRRVIDRALDRTRVLHGATQLVRGAARLGP
jgi:hypothetical protein